jgi:hypothetical protein
VFALDAALIFPSTEFTSRAAPATVMMPVMTFHTGTRPGALIFW